MAANGSIGPDEFDPQYRLVLENRRQRNLNRRLFREMIKTELDDGPLSWLKRRALVRFAVRLGIDAFETRLIIRAVEFECGRARAGQAVDDEETLQSHEFLAPSPGIGESWLGHLLAIGVIGAIAATFWLIGPSR